MVRRNLAALLSKKTFYAVRLDLQKNKIIKDYLGIALLN
jgi:hypothetical protein